VLKERKKEIVDSISNFKKKNSSSNHKSEGTSHELKEKVDQ